MKNSLFCFFFLIFISGNLKSQQVADSVVLDEVSIEAYLDKEPLLRAPASVTVIDSAAIHSYPGQSLVSPVNTVAGVRMEERSPMSYRLSIRGSLLRSPFGIRNVKIYIDEFPLTDAGGNSYLNLIDVNAVSKIEILKGPDGSLFGANSGGVVRLNVNDLPPDSFRITAQTGIGSYGLWHENVKLEKRIGNHIFSFSEAIQHCDGYRENSSTERKYFQATENWSYTSASQLRLLLFYSDLDYQTPGGLTLQQWNDDPRAARPPTTTLPGASEQHAGVHNQTLYGGILNETHFLKHFRHVIAVFGSHTDFENPFITNYEKRDETTSGIRTWVEAKTDQQKKFALKYDLGIEAQQTFSKIDNYDNLSGTPGNVQDHASLHCIQDFIFTRLSLDVYHRLLVEASASYNESRYTFTSLISLSGSKKFVPQIMPRLAISFLLTEAIAWRASVSKGYSPPTLAEIRSSDNTINISLQPETGWNYETGFRFHEKSGRAQWDVSMFYYRLQHAIVRRLNDDGEEYFVNAGGTKQLGAELQTTTFFIRQRSHGLIRRLQLSNGTSLSNFIFDNYSLNGEDFSGNQLTGVPGFAIVSRLEILFPQNISLFIGHNFTSSIPLNDANTVYAPDYRIVDLKIGWSYFSKHHFVFGANAGVNNLLNEKYSLGNDLNAAGGRYYNAAPRINYFISAFVRLE
jgi:iron complex outermembrane receptor protein